MKKEELRRRVDEILSRGIDTNTYYFSLYKDLEGARHALHQSIVRSILTRKNYSRERRIFMLGGAPASGKSAFIRSGVVQYPPMALKIDPDEIKSMLPEYRLMVDSKERQAAMIVHEESSDLSKMLRNAAIDEGMDLILDGVMNESLEKRLEDLSVLKSNGHRVRIDYLTLDTQLSIKLARNRFQRTGRYVPEKLIRETSRNLAVLIPQLIDYHCFDELYLWGTTIGKGPRLILRQKNGKLDTFDRVLYEDFKRKAHEE